MLNTDWQYTEPIEGIYFKFKHTSFPVNNSYLIAQAQVNLDSSVELSGIQEFHASDEAEVIFLKVPPVFTDRRIAIKRLAKQSSLASELRRIIRNDLLTDADAEYTQRRSAWSVAIEASDYVEAVVPPPEPTPPANPGVALTYASDGDANGVFYWLGTNKLTQAFANPALNGNLVLTAKTTFHPGYPVDSLSDRTSAIYLSINDSQQWVKVDLGANRSLILTQYTWKGSVGETMQPRNWSFQGSNNDLDWIDLDIQNNATQPNIDTWFSKAIVGQTVKYRYFRFFQTGVNSQGTNYLAGQELELYGILITTT